MPYDLFISYSRRDNTQGRITQLVERIKADFAPFAKRGLVTFFDQQEIAGMSDWRQRILQGLRESRLLLACLSPAYLQSEYCEWEFIEYLSSTLSIFKSVKYQESPDLLRCLIFWLSWEQPDIQIIPNLSHGITDFMGFSCVSKMDKVELRACLKIRRSAVIVTEAGWQGATRENTPSGSSTEEQRRQPGLGATTLRAAGLLPWDCVVAGITARCGDVPPAPPCPQPKSIAAAPRPIFRKALEYEIGHLHGFNGVAPIYFVEVPGWDSEARNN